MKNVLQNPKKWNFLSKTKHLKKNNQIRNWSPWSLLSNFNLISTTFNQKEDSTQFEKQLWSVKLTDSSHNFALFIYLFIYSLFKSLLYIFNFVKFNFINKFHNQILIFLIFNLLKNDVKRRKKILRNLW